MESEVINRIIEIVDAHQVAMDWYYNEKLTEDEYNANIGEFNRYNPEEIIDDLHDYINDYKLNKK